MEEQLAELERVIERLSRQIASVQKRNKKLTQEQSTWIAERDALQERCDSAYARIDAIVAKLQDAGVTA